MSDSHQEHGHAPCAQGQCGQASAAPAHEEHGHGPVAGHGDHGHGHNDHGHGHDDHGQGHGGHSPWIDYNAKPLQPSTLPPVSAIVLAVVGAALAVVLALIVNTSLALAAQPLQHEHHGASAHEGGAAPEHHQPGNEH